MSFELKFRDGMRSVPPLVAELMEGIDTHKLTYDEAIKEMNRRQEQQYLSRQFNDFVTKHFRGF